MRKHLIARVVLTFWLWYYSPLAHALAVEEISIRPYPLMGLVPHSMRVTVRIDPNEENRELCLLWGLSGEEGMESKSCETLDGVNSRRTFYFPRSGNNAIVLREAGEWIFTADIRKANGKHLSVSSQVTVIGR